MGDLFKDRQDHESYGVIGISRVSCGPRGKALFDSPFRHQHFIDITISRAYKARANHDDFIGRNEELIRVSMSEVQFANMITSPNMGVGTPCTIGHFDGKTVKEPPTDATRQTYSKEIKEEFADLKKTAEDLEKLIAATPMKVKDREKLQDLAGALQRAFSGDLAFFQQQFEEKMEKVVSAARAEIQAHVTHVVEKAGLQAIKDGQEPFRLEDMSGKK